MTLALCFLGLATAHAEEPARPTPAPEVGRALLSPDEDVRAKAVAALREAVRSGAATDTYVDALARAVSTWANHHARLADLWVERAVEGDARERRVAVRLLHALGPDAVERLALELRHQRHRPDIPRGTTAEQTVERAEARAAGAADAGGAEPQQAPSGPPDNRTPRIYSVKRLAASGMNALQIRSFLQKQANASQVLPYGDRYLVLAETDGHRRLQEALASRTRDATPTKPAPTTQAPGTYDAPKKTTSKDGVSVDPSPSGPARWHIQAYVLQVPREEAAALYGEAKADGGVVFRHGDPAAGRRWVEAARALPEARELGTWKPLRLADTQGATISAGKAFRFNKGVEKTESGAYRVVTGELHHGYIFAFRPEPADKAMVLRVDATRESISMPVPERVVTPAKNSAPIKVQEPQWSRATTSHSVSVSKTPRAYLLGFQGLDEQEPNDDVVLVLEVDEREAK